jgi:hypothetical protein
MKTNYPSFYFTSIYMQPKSSLFTSISWQKCNHLAYFQQSYLPYLRLPLKWVSNRSLARNFLLVKILTPA